MEPNAGTERMKGSCRFQYIAPTDSEKPRPMLYRRAEFNSEIGEAGIISAGDIFFSAEDVQSCAGLKTSGAST